MKIGIISTVGGPYSWAGSEEMWMLIALEALRAGHSVAVCLQTSFAASEEMAEFSRLGGVIFPYKPPNWIQRRLLSKGLHTRFGAMKRWGPDIVCTSGPPAEPHRQADLAAFLKTLEARQVHIVQGNDVAFVQGGVERVALRKLYEKSSLVICVSEDNANLLRRQTASPIANCAIFPNPIRIRMEKQGPLPIVSGSTVNFATVGRYEVWSKCQDVTLEALSTPEWKSRNWTLNLYGSGPDESYIKDLIDYYELNGKVRLMGFERDFRKIWKENHIHILNSRAEGLALALIESMFCGRPAVVTRTGGNHELVRNGIDGYVSGGDNVESVRDTLEKAWRGRPDWEQMGSSAYDRANNWVPVDLGSRLLDRVLS